MFTGEQPFLTFAYEKKDSAISGVSMWPKNELAPNLIFMNLLPRKLPGEKAADHLTKAGLHKAS